MTSAATPPQLRAGMDTPAILKLWRQSFIVKQGSGKEYSYMGALKANKSPDRQANRGDIYMFRG
jgi:hypothetical protein